MVREQAFFFIQALLGMGNVFSSILNKQKLVLQMNTKVKCLNTESTIWI